MKPLQGPGNRAAFSKTNRVFHSHTDTPGLFVSILPIKWGYRRFLLLMRPPPLAVWIDTFIMSSDPSWDFGRKCYITTARGEGRCTWRALCSYLQSQSESILNTPSTRRSGSCPGSMHKQTAVKQSSLDSSRFFPEYMQRRGPRGMSWDACTGGDVRP